MILVGIGAGIFALICWSDAPRVERERLQKLHEEQEKLHENEEHLLDRQLIRQIYAKIQSWDDDGLEVNSFAQQILKQIGKLKKTFSLDFSTNP